ncbi:alanine racemase [Martelella mediterranea]|uniref:Alanine racemase n=1 Tax=Martelella mediterranea TaxID=293089 RepID=A0A4R3NT00_9HYPH|nr:alanine racemase [Martelella mediterranea]TCT36439.1 alanine racemase [Martelella mediterranea]
MTDYSNELIDEEAEAEAFESAASRLTVDLGAIVENWKTMQRLSGSARAAAVLKADAYGLGVEDVGEALYEAGARDFFVALPEEGANLRTFAPEARIFVLSGMWPGSEQFFFDYDLVPVLISREQIALFSAVTSEHGEHPCALQVDTGFNRLGLSVEEALELAEDTARPATFSPVLILSHLACGDDANAEMNREQLERFRLIADAFEGIETSLSASAGIFLGSDYHFDLTRPGIALYGGDSQPGTAKQLKTVATAEARILQIRNAKAGETVSYGATWKLERDSRLAIVATGYADGYMRAQSGSGTPVRDAVKIEGHGYIAGHRVPIAGRITMDLTIFDVTDVPESKIRPGDFIELIGPHIPVDEAAEAAGTIGYEILTSLGLRYQRRYIQPS